MNQDAFDHDKGQKSAISGRRLHWILFFSPVDCFFPFSPGFMCSLARNGTQNMQKIARFPGREKKRRILLRLWLSWFFLVLNEQSIQKRDTILVAPYCAIPRDYLSNTPLLRAMGFLVSQHGQLGAIPPPPFLSVSPLESMRSGGAIPPLKRGISAILARYPMKAREMGAIPPAAILSRKGIARYGGVSRTGPLR